MSLQTRLEALVAAIGTDVKSIRTSLKRDLIGVTPTTPVSGSIEWTTDGKSLDMKATDGTVTRIGPGGAPLATAVTNSSANSVYPDNTSYFRYVLTTDGFSITGMLSGIRVGTVHTQRLQDIASTLTYSRYWINASTAWSPWIAYLDGQDYDVKGDLLVGTGADTFARQASGVNGQVLSADSTASTGVKWANSSGGQTFNSNVVTSGLTFGNDVYVVGSECIVPSGSLKAKTMYRCTFSVSKTAAGVVAPIINVRVGVGGVAAQTDASRATLTFAAQTAVVDEGLFEVLVTFRTVGAGTAAVIQAVGTLTHRLAATGLSVDSSGTKVNTGAGFDSTTATFIGLSLAGGTSAVFTIALVQADLVNLA